MSRSKNPPKFWGFYIKFPESIKLESYQTLFVSATFHGFGEGTIQELKIKNKGGRYKTICKKGET